MTTKHLKVTFVALALSVGTAWGSAHLVRLHGSMDVNQDGIVSAAEFMNLWEKSFDRQDKNKDDRLSVDECGGSVMVADKNKDGEMRAMYEPIHGSAPDIAGKGIANPIASILSFAMALRYSLDLDKEAEALEKAVQSVLNDGLRTKDIMSEGKKEVSTSQMGAAIISKLQ